MYKALQSKYATTTCGVILIGSFIIILISMLNSFILAIDPKIVTATVLENSEKRIIRNIAEPVIETHVYSTKILYDGYEGFSASFDSLWKGTSVKVQYSQQFPKTFILIPYSQERPLNFKQLIKIVDKQRLFMGTFIFIFSGILLIYIIYQKKKKPSEAEQWLDTMASRKKNDVLDDE